MFFKHCSVAGKKYSSIPLSKAEKQSPLGKKAIMFNSGTGLSVPCISSWLADTAFLALVPCLGIGKNREFNSYNWANDSLNLLRDKLDRFTLLLIYL